MKSTMRIVLIAVATVVAVGLGVWVGDVTAPRDVGQITSVPADSRLATGLRNSLAEQAARKPYADAFYFMGPMSSVGESEVVAEEIAMAAEAGVHRHMVWAPLPWDPEWERLEALIRDYVAADPDGVFILNLDLNPPTSWLAAHPDETASTMAHGLAYPSVGSVEWVEALADQFQQLAEALSEIESSRAVVGATLAALEEGRWYRTDGYDRSKAASEAFRTWLRERYGDAAALQTAWSKPGLAFEAVVPPTRPVNPEAQPLLLRAPEERAHADYLTFLSEQTAAVIRRLAALGKELGGEQFEVYVPYGFTLELPGGDAGHFALRLLRESAITGFIAPVSYQNRGIGGVGGAQVLLDGLSAWPQRWILVDDTRTGIVNTGGEDGAARPLGLKLDDILSVYRRNFGMALLHGANLAWSDPAGEGNLHEPSLWSAFGELIDLANGLPTTLAASEPALPEPTLIVAVSEEAVPWTRPGSGLNESLIRDLRDVVLQSGIPSRFVPLRDVVSGTAPPGRLYVIPNAFTLTPSEREALHARFTQERAGVIWLYAPGFASGGPALEAIRAATMINVMAIDGPQPSGSTIQIAGDWLTVGDVYSTGLRLEPAFYVEDESADALTLYDGTERVSGAMRFLDEGWASVYLAEPTLPVGLLREIANILEVPMLFRKTQLAGEDLVDFRRGLMLIHGGQGGDRLLNLQAPHRVEGLLHPNLGWPNNALINIVLNAGETYLFRAKRLEFVPTLPAETIVEELPPAEEAVESEEADKSAEK